MKPKYGCWTGILLAAFLMVSGQFAHAQRVPPPIRTQPPLISDEPGPSSDQNSNRKLLKASYAQLQKDVQRLSDLADELKDEVTNSDEDVFSLSGMKKAEEIEKLSKKIQSRMKNL